MKALMLAVKVVKVAAAGVVVVEAVMGPGPP